MLHGHLKQHKGNAFQSCAVQHSFAIKMPSSEARPFPRKGKCVTIYILHVQAFNFLSDTLRTAGKLKDVPNDDGIRFFFIQPCCLHTYVKRHLPFSESLQAPSWVHEATFISEEKRSKMCLCLCLTPTNVEATSRYDEEEVLTR